ncbi:hypothetical protein ACFV9E_28880 [Streptomyces sp. NPDC059835]|uniref:hypothetical protein n=1 Tax=Streptomyces sp. NPDC059835 TaxID=3346967 RepID=UPI00364F2F3A
MFIRPVGVTVRSADRPSGHPLLRGLLAQATGTGSVDVDGPRQGVRWSTAGPIEPEPVGVEDGVEGEDGVEEGLEDGLEVADVEPGSGGHAEGSPAGSFVAELTQLASLAREGLLTPQEFATAKGRLLRE